MQKFQSPCNNFKTNAQISEPMQKKSEPMHKVQSPCKKVRAHAKTEEPMQIFQSLCKNSAKAAKLLRLGPRHAVPLAHHSNHPFCILLLLCLSKRKSRKK